MTNNTIVDRSTDVVAGAAVTSPVWLPWLQQTSEIAALLVPIFGVIWLVIQIVGYLSRREKE
jgi:hypothetical protein